MRKFITRMITFVMAAVMVINSTSISALADTGVNSMSKSTVNVQNFNPSMVATIETIVQDKETAVTIMQELYKTGLVDATGKPVANKFFDVDGKTMSMDELRNAADVHVLDESAAVSIDGYEVTWGYVRSLLAIKEMEESLNEAKANGYTIDEKAVIDFANQLNLGNVLIKDKTTAMLGGRLLGANGNDGSDMGATRILLTSTGDENYWFISATQESEEITEKLKELYGLQSDRLDTKFYIPNEKVKYNSSSNEYYIYMDLLTPARKQDANRVTVFIWFPGLVAIDGWSDLPTMYERGINLNSQKPEFCIYATRDNSKGECSVELSFAGGDLVKSPTISNEKNEYAEAISDDKNKVTISFANGVDVVELGLDDIYSRYKADFTGCWSTEQTDNDMQVSCVTYMELSNCKNCVVGMEYFAPEYTNSENETIQNTLYVPRYGTSESYPIVFKGFTETSNWPSEDVPTSESPMEFELVAGDDGAAPKVYFYGDRIPFGVKMNYWINSFVRLSDDTTTQSVVGGKLKLANNNTLANGDYTNANFAARGYINRFWFDYVCDNRVEPGTISAGELVFERDSSYDKEHNALIGDNYENDYVRDRQNGVLPISYSSNDFFVNSGACEDIRFSTPDKVLSFEPENVTYEKGEKAAAITGDTENVYLRIPVKNVLKSDGTVDDAMLDYISWLCADVKVDAKSRNYLKSMLGAGSVKDADGNLVSYLNPVYIELDNKTFEYVDPDTQQKVNCTELPVAIWTKAELDGTTDGSFACKVAGSKEHNMLGAIEFVGLRAIGGTTDITSVLETQTTTTLAEKLATGEWCRFVQVAACYDTLINKENKNYTNKISRDYEYSKLWVFPCLDIAKVFLKSTDLSINYNDTWKGYQEDAGSVSDHSIPSLTAKKYNYDAAHGAGRLTLSYNIGSGTFDNTSADCFSWESSDETIATITDTVDATGKTTGVIGLTGKTGTVKFTLKNKENTVVWESANLTVAESTDPYLFVPSTSQPVIALKNYEADVLLCTNVSAYNDAAEAGYETAFEMMVYKAVPDSSSGTTVYKKGDKVLTEAVSAKGTKDVPVSSLRIPSKVLSTVSESGSVSYIAEIKAKYIGDPAFLSEEEGTWAANGDGTYDLIATTTIKVKNAPVKAQFKDLTNNYFLDDKDNVISWEVLGDCNDNTDWALLVTDEEGMIVKTDSGKGNMPSSYTFTKGLISENSELQNNTLKKVYTVTFSVSNNAAEDGYSVASSLIYLYNSKALDILVSAVNHSTPDLNDGGKSDKVTLENETYIKSIAAGDGRIDLGEISIADLQTDITLKAVVSINYGDYVWGLVSDQLQWTVNDLTPAEGEAVIEAANLYYSQGGRYGNVDFNLLPSFMPISSFLLVGEKDGKGTLTCTHARSGLKTTVDVEVETLTDKLYLFQFFPLGTVSLTFTDNKKQKHTVQSDANGQLALYVPDGIDPSSKLFFSAEIDGVPYAGVYDACYLQTGERNAAFSGLYPLNNLKMVKSEMIDIYIKTPDGKPYANKEVTVHGGIFFNADVSKAVYEDGFDNADANKKISVNGYVYQPKMDILTYAQFMNPDELEQGDKTTSNGLEALKLTTDSKGMLRLVANMKQSPLGEALKQGEDIMFILQIETTDDYRPVILQRKVLMDNQTSGGASVVNLTSSLIYTWNPTKIIYEYTKAVKPFTNKITEYRIGEDGIERPITIGDKVNALGADTKNPRRSGRVETLMWGEMFESVIDKSDKDKQCSSSTDFSKYEVYFSDVLKGIEHNKTLGQDASIQSSHIWYYPFSTIALADTYMPFDADNFINGEDPWLPCKTSIPADIAVFDVSGDSKKVILRNSFPYRIANNLDATDLSRDAEFKRNIKAYLEKMKEEEEFSLGDVIPGGDIISSCMALVSGLATGGDYQMNMTVSATADPTVYKVLVNIGEESGVLTPEQTGQEEDEIENGIHSHYGDDALDPKDLDKAFDEFMGEDPKKDDDDDKYELKFAGALIGEAKYDSKNKKWEYSVTGGSFTGGVEFKAIEEKENILVGPVPVTYSIEAKASILRTITVDHVIVPRYYDEEGKLTYEEIGPTGYSREEADPESRRGFMLDSVLGAEVKAFVGLGFDFSVVALKFGIEGSLAANLYFALGVLGVENSQIMAGAGISLEGGISLQFEASILFVKYKKVFASASFEAGIASEGYTEITSLFPGSSTAMDEKYAGGYAGGTAEFMGRKATGSTNDEPKIVMSAGRPKGEVIYKVLGKDDTYGNISVSDDGKYLFYTDDYTASYALASDGTNQGFIFDPERDEKAELDEKGDYGHFYMDGSGSGDNLFATWVVQTYKGKTGEMTPEESLADLSMALNSTEIDVAHYDKNQEKWITERITDNGAPDMAPTVSSNGNKAFVAWRSLYGSDASNPLNFNVDDNILYARYDGSKWEKGSEIIYNGSNGKVQSLDSCMLNNGTVVLTYTVQTDTTGDVSGLEVFYSIVDPAGNVTTVNASSNPNRADDRAQVISLDDTAILAWYSVAGENTSDKNESAADIYLLGIKQNGAIVADIPQSVTAIDADAAVTNIFAITGNSVEDFSVAWVLPMEEPKAEGDDSKFGGMYSSVYASKITKSNVEGGSAVYTMTTPAEVIKTGRCELIDNLAMKAVPDSNVLEFYLSKTVYTGEPEIIGYLPVDEVILRKNYKTDEKYNEAVKKFNELYGDEGCPVKQVPGHFGLERKEVELKPELSLTAVRYQQENVYPGATIPVKYTVKNTGVGAIDYAMIDGTKYELNLAPNGEKDIVILTPVTNPVSDHKITIEPATDGVKFNGGNPITGKLKFNIPKIDITEAKVIKEGEGKRTISVQLANDSMINLAGSGRKLEVALYTGLDMAGQLGSPVVLGDTEAEDVLQRTDIDNGAGSMLFEMSIDDYISVYNAGKPKEELTPEWMEVLLTDGVDLVVVSKVKDDEGKTLYECSKNVSIKSLILDEENPVTMSILDPVVTPDDPASLDADGNPIGAGTVTVSGSVRNDSIINKGTKNLAVTIFDNYGKEIAKQILPIELKGESKFDFNLNFELDAVEAYASMSYEELEKAELGTAENDDFVFVGWYTDSAFTTTAGSDALIGYAKWDSLYRVAFDMDGDATTTTDVITLDYGAAMTIPTPANKSGYKFMGWKLDSEVYADGTALLEALNTREKTDGETIGVMAVYAELVDIAVYIDGTVDGTQSGNKPVGYDIELTAPDTADSGLFMGWYDGDENLLSKDNPYTYTVEKAASVWAKYIQLTTAQENAMAILTELAGDDDSDDMAELINNARAAISGAATLEAVENYEEQYAGLITEQYQTDLEQAKTDAVADLEAMVDDNASDDIKDILDTAIAAVTDADTITAVNTACDNGKSAIQVQYETELAAAKEDAITELADMVDENTASDDLKEVLATAKTAVNAADTLEAVQTALSAGKQAIQAQLDDEELAAAKADAIDTLKALVDEDTASDDMKDVLADAIEAVNLATTVDDVDTALASGKTAIEDQIEAELTAAKADATDELEALVDDSTASDELKAALADAIAAVGDAATVSEVNTALASGKTAIENQLTSDIAAAKADATATLKALVDEDTASDDMKTVLADALAAVDDAATVSEVNTALANGKTAIADQIAAELAAELAAAKSDATDELEDMVDANASDELKAILEDAIAAVQAAATVDEVTTASADGKTAIQAQIDKELAAKTLEEAKADAVEALNLKAGSNPSDEVKQILADAIAEVNNATTKDDVQTALASGKTAIQTQLDKEAAAKELAEAKEAAVADLKSQVDDSTASDELKQILEDAIAAVNNAATVSEVNNAAADGENAIQEQLDKEEAAKVLAAAKTAAAEELTEKAGSNPSDEVKQILADAIAEVNAATTVSEVDTAVTSGETAIRAQLDKEAADAAAKELAEAKEAAVKTLTEKAGSNPSEEMKKVLADAIAEVNNATTKDAVQTAAESGETAIQTQLDKEFAAKTLEEAKEAAVEELTEKAGSNPSEEMKKVLADAIAEVNNATTKDAVQTAAGSGATAIQTQLDKEAADAAAKELAEAKEAAVEALTEKAGSNPSEEMKKVLADAIAAVNNSATKSDVQTAAADGEAAIQAQLDKEDPNKNPTPTPDLPTPTPDLPTPTPDLPTPTPDLPTPTPDLPTPTPRLLDDVKAEAISKLRAEASGYTSEEIIELLSDATDEINGALTESKVDSLYISYSAELLALCANESRDTEEDEFSISLGKVTKADKKCVEGVLDIIKQYSKESGNPEEIDEVTIAKTYKLALTEEYIGEKINLVLPKSLINEDPSVKRLYYVVSRTADGEVSVEAVECSKGTNILSMTVKGNGRYIIVYADVPYFVEKGTVLKTTKKKNAVYKVVVPGNVAGKVGVVKYVRPINSKKNITIKATVKIDGISYRVETIGNNAFKNDLKLRTITLGTNISKITTKTFKGCKNLNEIKVHGTIIDNVKAVVDKLKPDIKVTNLDE